MWGAELINRSTFTQDSLVGGANSLYATSQGYLDRISPVTGNVVASARYTAPIPGPPVVLGSTVWVVSSYAGGDVALKGYDAKTLAQVASVAGAGQRSGVRRGRGSADQRARRGSLRGRGRHRGGGESRHAPGNQADQRVRGAGELGGRRARRGQAVCQYRLL